jgi:hypothetical protein
MQVSTKREEVLPTYDSFGIVGKNVKFDTKFLGVGYGADQNLLPYRQNHPRA